MENKAPRPRATSIRGRLYRTIETLKGGSTGKVFKYVNTDPKNKPLTRRQVNQNLQNMKAEGFIDRDGHGVWYVASLEHFESLAPKRKKASARHNKNYRAHKQAKKLNGTTLADLRDEKKRIQLEIKELNLRMDKIDRAMLLLRDLLI